MYHRMNKKVTAKITRDGKKTDGNLRLSSGFSLNAFITANGTELSSIIPNCWTCCESQYSSQDVRQAKVIHEESLRTIRGVKYRKPMLQKPAMKATKMTAT